MHVTCYMLLPHVLLNFCRICIGSVISPKTRMLAFPYAFMCRNCSLPCARNIPDFPNAVQACTLHSRSINWAVKNKGRGFARFATPFTSIVVRWFIIRGGGAWASMHCWFNVTIYGFVMAHKPWDLSLSAVPRAWEAKLHAAISPVKEATTGTHMLGLNFTMKSWAEYLAPMSVIMHGPYLKPTQLLCVIWQYCLWAAWSCLSWSAVTFSKSIGEELDSKNLKTFNIQCTFSTCVNFISAHSGSPQLNFVKLSWPGLI